MGICGQGRYFQSQGCLHCRRRVEPSELSSEFDYKSWTISWSVAFPLCVIWSLEPESLVALVLSSDNIDNLIPQRVEAG
jgi:hypothetical protein